MLAFMLLLIALSIGVGVYIASCTQFAPWGYSDSAAFFSAARNLASIHGVSVSMPDLSYSPLTLHAPLFPMLLSVFAKLNIDLINASRFLDIFFASLFVFLSGWLFFKITGQWVAAILFALASAISAPLASLFTSIMSEPLAMLLGIPGILFLILGVKRGSLKWIIVGGVLGGLAFITRFAFAALSAAGFLTILIFSDAAFKKRGLWALIYTFLSGLPMLLWAGIQSLERTTTGGRSAIFNSSTPAKIVEAIRTAYSTLKYWFPYRTGMIPGIRADFFTPVLAVLFLLLIAAAFAVTIRRIRRKEKPEAGFIVTVSFMLYIACYFVVLVASYAFSTVIIDINARMLAPLIPAVVGMLIGAAISIGSLSNRVLLSSGLALFVSLFFVVFNTIPLKEYLVSTGNYSGGYASRAWRNASIFGQIDLLPTDAILVSNAPDAVLFYTNRYPYCLAESKEDGGCYPVSSLGDLTSTLENQCAAAIVFPAGRADAYESYADPITQESADSLKSQHYLFYDGEDGYILFLNQCDLKNPG